MRSIAIHQPNIFPRLKVLQKIGSANIWVIYDDVQYVNREWQNRVKFRNYSNPKQEFWFTVPVYRPKGRTTFINEVLIIDPNRVANKLSKVVTYTYSRSPYKKWIFEYIDRIINKPITRLVSLGVATTVHCFDMLKIDVETIYSSSLNVSGNKNEKLINICRAINATHDLSTLYRTNF